MIHLIDLKKKKLGWGRGGVRGTDQQTGSTKRLGTQISTLHDTACAFVHISTGRPTGEPAEKSRTLTSFLHDVVVEALRPQKP